MSDLIKVTKAGVVLGVHPTCLAAHQAAGWTQTEAEINAGLPEEDAEPAKTDGPVEIPGGWADLHHAKRVKLAKALGAEPANASEADAAIEAEVAKRAAEAAPTE
jgi:hypothetical protein